MKDLLPDISRLHPPDLIHGGLRPKILLVPDKFKGSLTAPELCELLSEWIQSTYPLAEIDQAQLADGGEGTMATISSALRGQVHHVPVHDPLGRIHQASFSLAQEPHSQETLGILEMSSASGWSTVQDLPRSPRDANTYGTGELMNAAIQAGATRLLIGIGGSATNDGGSGMARALGYRFLDAQGNELVNLPKDLEVLHVIEPPASRVSIEITVACDVTNPLLGELGCTRFYGPQKGVQVEDFEWFERRLERLSKVITECFGNDYRELEGAGAAGGMGFALKSFLNAKLESGFELVSDFLDLRTRIAQADLIITGEGCLDAQTAHGKGPAEVARLGAQYHRPVLAVCGLVKPDAQDTLSLFDAVISVVGEDLPLESALQHPQSSVRQRLAASTPILQRFFS